MPGYKSKKLMAEMKVTDYEAAFRKLVDKWHESVRHYEDRIEKDAAHIDEMYDLVAVMNAGHTASKTRIEKLEAANLKQSCIKIDDQMRIEKLEAALRWIIEQERQTAHPTVCAIVETARKALEGKDD